MAQVSASSSSPASRTPSLIAQAIAAIRTQVRGLAELLAFFVAGAAALSALFSDLLAGARPKRGRDSPWGALDPLPHRRLTTQEHRAGGSMRP